VLGGITLVLYGMIGLLGAKIWIENRIDFGNPINLVPLAAGIIAGIGNLVIKFTDTFSITGIAAGTLIVLIGYHLLNILAPRLGVPRTGGVLADPAEQPGHADVWADRQAGLVGSDELGRTDPAGRTDEERSVQDR